jgi:hypothetical protein
MEQWRLLGNHKNKTQRSNGLKQGRNINRATSNKTNSNKQHDSRWGGERRTADKIATTTATTTTTAHM